MHRRKAASAFFATALLLSAAPVALAAQEDSFGFRFAFGWQEMAGDLGANFDGAVDSEFSILIPVSFLRVGGGANWASLNVTGEEASWSQVRFHALVGAPFRLTERVHPYVEGRYTLRHMRPEDDRYFEGEDKVLRDFKSTGGGLQLVGGVAIFMSPRVGLDLSAGYGTFSLSPDLSEEELGDADTGSSWRLQAGVTWFPTHGR